MMELIQPFLATYDSSTAYPLTAQAVKPSPMRRWKTSESMIVKASAIRGSLILEAFVC